IEQRGPVGDVTHAVAISYRRENVAVIVGVHEKGDRLLAFAIDTKCLPPLFFSSGARRQEQRGKNCDYRDHGEEVHQGESSGAPPCLWTTNHASANLTHFVKNLTGGSRRFGVDLHRWRQGKSGTAGGVVR